MEASQRWGPLNLGVHMRISIGSAGRLILKDEKGDAPEPFQFQASSGFRG